MCALSLALFCPLNNVYVVYVLNMHIVCVCCGKTRPVVNPLQPCIRLKKKLSPCAAVWQPIRHSMLCCIQPPIYICNHFFPCISLCTLYSLNAIKFSSLNNFYNNPFSTKEDSIFYFLSYKILQQKDCKTMLLLLKAVIWCLCEETKASSLVLPGVSSLRYG